MAEPAFQDQGSVHHCHGCGADNERGLRLKSYWDGDEAVANWHAEPHHCGGTPGNLNGGIIASLIDCHSLNLAIAHAYRVAGRPIGSAPRIGYVTASLQVSLCETDADRSAHRAARAHHQTRTSQGLGELYAQRGRGIRATEKC